MSHTAIYNTHPNVFSINGDGEKAIAWDKNGNIVQIDLVKAAAEEVRLETKAIQDKIETENVKKAAEAKLAKLRLTPEDLKALLG
jgi:hypothetical protein